MNFDQALEYLLRLGHETLTIKFGLENTQKLLEGLGQPHCRFPKVQIAGTNGKGSTAFMLDAICRESGIKTGTYTSPHLISITERVCIDGQLVSEETFARLTSQVSEVAKQLVETGILASLPTFFEHVTAIALVAFRDAGVELGILETGLGGRLDATTAAAAEVVAITPIAVDHQEYLGQTLVEIAGEKAAIIRPRVSPIIAPQPREAMDVILERCAKCCVQPLLVNQDVQIIDADHIGRVRATFRTQHDVYENVRVNLAGRHQAVNASVAIAIAEVLISRGFFITHEAIIAGLESAEHAGRLEWRVGHPSFLFDGAHNPAGALGLRAYLDEFVTAPLTLVFGAMRDKDLSEIAATLFPAAEHIVLTEIDNPRSATVGTLALLARDEIDSGRAILTANVMEALRVAVEQTPSGGLICVTGSLYLVGEVQAMLQHEEQSIYVN